MTYEVPQEWNDELEELRARAATYPEDIEDRVLREGTGWPNLSEETKQIISDLVLSGEFKAVVDEAIKDDPDLRN